jgi:hypothetical protein
MNDPEDDYADARPVDRTPNTEIAPAMTSLVQGGSLLNIAALMTVARRNEFRRDITRAMKDAEAIVTLDKDTAKTCFYALPARSGGDGKKIMGPSIGMAETLFSAWGNMIVSLDNVEENEFDIIVRGWIIDSQNGSSTQDFVRRRIQKSNGQRYGADMINVTVQAARSVLFRNLVLRMVPRPMVRKLFNSAFNVAMGDGVSFEQRQKNAVTYWIKQGVPQERLLQHLGHTRIGEISVEDMEYLIGIEQSLKLGDVTIDDIFNPKPAEAAPTTGKMEALNEKATKGKEKPQDAPQDAPKETTAPKTTTTTKPKPAASKPAPAPEPEPEPEPQQEEPPFDTDPKSEGREPGSDDVEEEAEEEAGDDGPVTDAQTERIIQLKREKTVAPKQFAALMIDVGNDEAKMATLTQSQAVELIAALEKLK